MKKLVFAVQVFGIIAMFPIYVILEMNHGTEKLPESNNHPVAKEEVEKAAIRASFNFEARNENSIRLTYLWNQDILFVRMK